MENMKMTYVQALEAAIACEALSAEVREKLEALKGQTAKRNSGNKSSAKDKEREANAMHLLEVMKEVGVPGTITDFLHADLEGLKSCQNATALMNILQDMKLVDFKVDKRRKYFFIK